MFSCMLLKVGRRAAAVLPPPAAAVAAAAAAAGCRAVFEADPPGPHFEVRKESIFLKLVSGRKPLMTHTGPSPASLASKNASSSAFLDPYPYL